MFTFKNSRVMPFICLVGMVLTACDSSTSLSTVQDTTKSKEPVSNTVIDKSDWVGQVGNHPFTEKDINREFSQMPEKFQKMKDNLQMRGNILNNIMTRYALVEQAKKEGIDKIPEIQAQLERMEQTILLQALNKQAKDKMAPANADIKAYYDANKVKFSVKEQVHVAHILVKDEDLARKIYKQLKHGEDFSSLAKQYSIDSSSKNKGGDLAPFSKGMMVKEFEDAAFALSKDGDFSKPVKTHYGFHLIKLIAHVPSHQKSLEEVKPQIISILTQENFRNWVTKIKDDMKVVVLKPSYKLHH